jgi:ATP-dependent RNA helicase RhlE
MAFSQLGLNDRLVQGILATGYTAPTAIQARAIPLALEGKDIIGCAQTGTGKTAAFVLPMLNHLSKSADGSREKRPRSLVLTPTRELAQQIEDALKQYGQFLKLRSVSIYGGVAIDKQLKHLRSGVDIIIATPGRLIDHLDRKSLDLSAIEILVLDEADRMFDMGFINDVKKILSRVPATRQTLLFSATMSKEIRALASSVQKNPEIIQIGEEHKPVDSVTQYFYSSPQDMKMDMLLFALQHEAMDSVLVFSRTKHGADKITKKLDRANVKAIAIHSNRTQAQRQRALAGFKEGHYQVLVATDIAARGIDVDGISHVINYDVPTFAEEYVHRIGRTGRASAVGDAITFVSRDEIKHVKKIEYFIGKKVEIKKYPTFNYTPAAHKPEAGAAHQAGEESESGERRRGDHQRSGAKPSERREQSKHPRTRAAAPAERSEQHAGAKEAPHRTERTSPNAYRDERPGSNAARQGKFAPQGQRRTPKVEGSTVPRRERTQTGTTPKGAGHTQQSGSSRFGRPTTSAGSGKFRTSGTRNETLPPAKKRVKPAMYKTESYSTGAYNDSFGSFRHSAPQATPDQDWKKLIETNESSFRKKLKKIFTRSED